MHVAFVNLPIEFYSPVSGGAIATIIKETASHLVAGGTKVSVLTPLNGDACYDVGSVIPIHVRTRKDLGFVRRRISSLLGRIARWDWPYYEYYLRSVRQRLRELRPVPDLLIAFNDLVLPRHLRMLCPDAHIFVWLQNECRTRRCNGRSAVAATDCFLTCSGYIRDWTAAAHGVAAEQFSVVHSGVNLDVFRPRDGFLSLRQEVRVLFLGRIDPNKGPDLAARAVQQLRSEGLSVRLTVAGGLWFYGHGNELSDPYFRQLKGKMDAAGAEYVGHVQRPEIPALIRDHDVVCVLSRSQEPFGLVVLEAMASGCAVLASNRGGLPEACGGAAMLVDPDDFESIVSCLRLLVTDSRFLASKKQAAVERASKASWSNVAEELVRLMKLKSKE